MKYKILTAILVLTLPLFITACTLRDLPVIGKFFSGGLVPQKDVTLNMWGLWEQPDVMEALVSKYKEQHPNVTIIYDDRSMVKPDQHKDTLKSRISEAGPADIVLIHNSWVDEFKGNLSPAPAGVISVTDYKQKFYPVASDSAIFSDKIYALPAFYDGLVLVYNKKHFDEIDQTLPPTAWEEFRKIALSLTIKGKDGEFVRSGAAIGSADNIDFFSDILGLMFAQTGVRVPVDLDTKPAQDALAYYTQFITEDGVWDSTLPEASIAFAQEKVSMIFVPSWNLLDLIRARPDLDIGVAPVPQALPDNPVSWASFWMYAVPQGSTNKEVAWDFINFLVQDEQQLQIFDLASRQRIFGAPYSTVSLSSQINSNPSAKYIKPLFDTASYSKSSFFCGRAGNSAYTNPLKDAINSVISKDSFQRASFEDALKTAKQNMVAPQAQ